MQMWESSLFLTELLTTVFVSEHFNILGLGHGNSPRTKILTLMGHQSKKERQSLPCAQQPTLLKGDASGCCKDVLNQYRLLEKGQVALSPFEEGWWVVSDYATHPKQTRGWWENTTCFCWQKQASLPTRRQLCSTSFKKIENKILHWKCCPVMVSVTYWTAICMQLCLYIEQCLEHRSFS